MQPFTSFCELASTYVRKNASSLSLCVQVVMLTGDNPLTACHVAKELKIATRKVLVLTARQDQWAWQSVGGSRTVAIDTPPAELGSTYDLCLAGEVRVYYKG